MRQAREPQGLFRSFLTEEQVRIFPFEALDLLQRVQVLSLLIHHRFGTCHPGGILPSQLHGVAGDFRRAEETIAGALCPQPYLLPGT
jgi:hypothetical protein